MPRSGQNTPGETSVDVASMLPSGFRKGTRIALLAAIAAGTATAQESAVETCRKTASDAERIACLEAALADAPEPSAPAAGSDAEPDRHSEPRDRGQPERSSVAGPEPVDGIGAQQVRSRTQTSADLTASLETARGQRVAGYVEVPYRRLQVELENGQVWRQITGDTQRLRVDLERNQTVDIEESRIGGYRLRLNEMGRTIRVERIR